MDETREHPRSPGRRRLRACRRRSFLGSLLLVSLLLAATTVASSPVGAPPQALADSGPQQLAQSSCFDTQGASGLDLVVAEFSRAGTLAGTFRIEGGRVGSGRWSEEGPGYPGPVLYHYRETARDACAVQLEDASRDVRIVLDMEAKRVLSRHGGAAQAEVLGEIDRTFGEKGVWIRGGGTAYGN